MRWIIALILPVVIGLNTPTQTAAQVVPACLGGTWTTDDLAGFYVSQPNRMALTIEPCGGMLVAWDNAEGRHTAAYQAVKRVDSGGVVASGLWNDGWYLDGQTAIAVSPAEPGYIKILTLSPYGTDPRQYRLEKVP